MLRNRLGEQTYHSLFYVGYLGIAVGLPLSKAVLSIALVYLILLFILGGEIKDSIRKIKTQPVFVLLLAFLFFHLLSFWWSEDFGYAFKDLKNKIPLYVLPFLWLMHPLKSQKETNWLLGLFVLSVSLASVINFGNYRFGWFGKTYVDIRSLSLFISHIRFSLMIVFATAISWMFIKQKTGFVRFLLLVLIAWFIYYTYYSQVLSGVLVLGGALICVLIYEMIQRKNIYFSILVLAFLVGIGSLFSYGVWFLLQKQELRVSLENLPEKTKEGNWYEHQTNPLILENGYPLYCFINEYELQREWNKRSWIPYDSLDRKGQEVRTTLIRFLNSKGLHKDAEGISALTNKDIQHIENGVPTIFALKNGFIARMHEMKYELLNNENPNGQSVSQRLIYWKTGFKIAKNNWFFGIGAGDIEKAFQKQYEADNSPLEIHNRNRSHNQLLTYFITFGVVGLLLFLWILLKAWKYCRAESNLLGILFLTIGILSFMVEDTLETQTGVTFFAFFFGYFMSSKQKNGIQ